MRFSPAHLFKTLLIFLLIVWVGLSSFDFHTPAYNAYFQEQAKEFKTALKALEALSKEGDIKTLRAQYRKSRFAYKRLELFPVYFTDITEKSLNGPLIPEVESFDPLNQVLPPQGLQVIESILWNEEGLDRILLEQEVQRCLGNSNKLVQLSNSQEMADWQIFEACQMEILRIMAMGLNNFDSPFQGNCFEESAQALEGISSTLIPYMSPLKKADKSGFKELSMLLKESSKKLHKAKDFESFDRASFIRNTLNPLYASIGKAQEILGYPSMKLPSPFNPTSKSILEKDAFNPDYFKTDYLEFPGKEQKLVNLGKLLFFDPILSGNGERACASCHLPNKAFSDGQKTSAAFNFDGELSRNTPSLLNVAFQQSLFWDARVSHLEDQVSQVTHNKTEMHGNLANAAKLLQQSGTYKRLFSEIFEGAGHDSIDAYSIQKAISAFERSLVAMDSPFDRYLRGATKNISPEIIHGFNLFMGKAQCGTCHFFPLYNGTVPPHYSKTEWEIIGVPSTSDTLHPALDGDLGRGAVLGVGAQNYAFKTPGIRNASLTAPYMHNGVYASLEEVIDFYDRGGGLGMGIGPANQTLPSNRLGLTPNEKQDLILFMESLVDIHATQLTLPDSLPQLEGNHPLNQRKLGGTY